MAEDKTGYVYILANQRNGTLYVGVTSDLFVRTLQHRNGEYEGFSKRYGCKMLVYYEEVGSVDYAIMREKQIKGGNRKKKLELIESLNPEWNDLFSDLVV